MSITAISHVALTVNELGPARHFWVDAMGFAPRIEQDDLVILSNAAGTAMVALVRHQDGMDGPFDERRVGLDHVALDIDGPDALRDWDTRLGERGVERSEIVESPFGWHLNVRAPENIAIELLAMRPEAAALLRS